MQILLHLHPNHHLIYTDWQALFFWCQMKDFLSIDLGKFIRYVVIGESETSVQFLDIVSVWVGMSNVTLSMVSNSYFPF